MKEFSISRGYQNFINPKERSLDYIHDLYLRACIRAGIFYKKRTELINKITDREDTKVKPKNGFKRTHEVFFRYTDREDIFKYEFHYYPEYKSWGFSSNRVEITDTKEGRDFKLKLLLNDDLFSLGQEFYELGKKAPKFHFWIREKLIRVINERLREHFKKINQRPSQTFQIELGGKKYYIRSKGDQYFEFELVGEVEENLIKL